MLRNFLLGTTILRSPDEPAVKPPAATGPVVDTPPGNQSAATPFSALPEPDRKFLGDLKIAALPDVVTALRDRETRLGASIELPKPDATLEQRKALYEKVRPKDAAAYEFALPKDLPQEFPYSAELATTARSTFHGLGLDPVQAKGVHDWYVTESAKQFKAQVDAVAAQEATQHEALVKKWGAPDSDTYKSNLALAGVAATKLGIMDSLKSRGVLSADGGVRDAAIVNALAEVGKALFKEGGAPGLGELAPSVNPWAKETWNETQQGQIMKADKARAKAMIQAAGKNPIDYGFEVAA